MQLFSFKIFVLVFQVVYGFVEPTTFNTIAPWPGGRNSGMPTLSGRGHRPLGFEWSVLEASCQSEHNCIDSVREREGGIEGCVQ